ncbi:MAG: VacB/RNase II family 3'-5' exoribonuclease [Planctomycetes bacterium]|nr:VacB/RNase II family 3'-5' exoribonuclease [Planctomycetota bacterium]
MNDSADSPAFSEHMRKRLLDLCAEPANVEDLARTLNVSDAAAFERWLEDLARQGFLQRIKRKRYQRPKGKVVTGVFRRGKHTAYVASSQGKIQVPPGAEEGAQEGDHVLVSMRKEKPGRKGKTAGEAYGKILNIIQARESEAVGAYELTPSGRGRVHLEGYNLPNYAWLSDGEGRNLKPGSIIRVRLSRKPSPTGHTRAELVGTLGNLRNPLEDLDNLCALFGFAGAFEPETLEETETLPENPNESEFHSRVDLRDLPVITIDPKDAQDHDDAISLELLEGGLTRLGVHIADVAHYVRPGSALDREAQHRATSVYLPGKTIPMLPRKLSNGLCSLHEGATRLALSCFMVFDVSGNEIRREVVQSVLKVRRYLTYEEVMPVLKGGASTGDATVDWMLVEGRNLADKLLAKRLERGALILDIQRPHVIVGPDGLVASIEPEKHDPAHNLIEEFMLAANVAVARFLLERGLPYLGRIHPAPDEDAKEAFWEFCDELRVRKPDFDVPGELQKMLNEIAKRPGADAINLALLRSMKRATYSPEPALHYALAVSQYVHFTSPIRRYPDTVTHQVLTAYLATRATLRFETRELGEPWSDGKLATAVKQHAKDGRDMATSEAWEMLMPSIAFHCTERSIQADRGEMAANQIKILRTLQNSIGKTVEGTIINVGARGVSVKLDGSLAEGTIDYRDLADGWVDTHKFWAIFETREGTQRLMMGDRVEVMIEAIDLASREMRLLPVGERERDKLFDPRHRGPQKRQEKHHKRRHDQNQRRHRRGRR